MNDPTLIIDPSLLAEFIDESLDMLSSVDSLFISLESDPGNLDIVQAIFRPVHSIKGNSSFFGFGKVKTLAHESETLLDLVRKKQLAVSKDLISVLLLAVDELKAMLERTRRTEPEVLDLDLFNSLISRLKDASVKKEPKEGERWNAIFDSISNVMQALPPEAEDLRKELAMAIGLLRSLAPGYGSVSSTVQNSPRNLLPKPIKAILEALQQPITDSLPEDKREIVDTALKQLPGIIRDTVEYREIIDDIIDTYVTFMGSVGFDGLLQELILEKINHLSEINAWKPVEEEFHLQQEATKNTVSTPATQLTQEKTEPTTTQKTQHSETTKTMRVSEAHIDNFLSYVGELLVVGDMFAHLQTQLTRELAGSRLVADFRHINETFGLLSQDLQRSIMSIRKVAVGTLLSRTPRIVRDVATASGKEIKVTLAGESVEVDKSLIDLLDAPLTHMVRNAADHGIEPPAIRTQSGKQVEGHIHIEVIEADTTIAMTVRDDGAGINREAIKAKALSLGLIRPEQSLTNDDIINCLFMSGVSTAKEITDVSGRGVGMDVVMRMVDEAGGRITVSTTQGQGSSFCVTLPKSVTTQILDGFIVLVNAQSFVLPMNRIRETVRVTQSDTTTVTGKGLCIKRHGAILPVVDMRIALDLQEQNKRNEFHLMVTAESHRKEFAIAVDGVRGIQQIVLRPLEGLERSTDLVSGGALLGDGTVALIVDIDKLSPFSRPGR